MSFRFNGNQLSTITLGSPAKLNLPGAAWWSAWIFPLAIASGTQSIFAQLNGAANSGQGLFEFDRGGNSKLGLSWAAAGGTVNLSSTGLLKAKVWQHVAAVRYGSAGSWSVDFFINGKFDSTTTSAVDPDTQEASAIGIAGASTFNIANSYFSRIMVGNGAISRPEVARLSRSASYLPRNIVAHFFSNKSAWKTDVISRITGTLGSQSAYSPFEPPLITARRARRSGVAAAGGTSFNQTVAAASSPIASVIRQTSKIAAAASSPAASGLRQCMKAVAAACGPVASTGRQIGKAVASSTSPVATIIRQCAKRVAASCSAAASAARGFAKTINAACGPVASLTAIKVILKTLDAACAPATSLARSIGKTIAASVTPPATVKRAIVKALSATVSPLAIVNRATAKTLVAAVSAIASAVRSIVKRIFASVQPAASIAANVGAVPSVTDIDPRFFFRAGKRRRKRAFGRGVR